MTLRDADDTVSGSAIVAVHECPCGTPVVVPLAGGCRCHGCGRLHAMGDPEAEDALAALSEMPGGSRRRGPLGDL